MKEQIEKMYIQALIDDLPPNVFADQVLRLFDVRRSDSPKCDKCGRFFSMKDWMNGKIGSYFEPDSDRGREILEFWHLYDCKRRSKI